jgi:TPR repeat protein
MDTSPDSQALPQGTHLQEFVIESVLGSGGFGITYLARDTSLGRQVVIKENLPAQFVWRETATGTVRPRHSVGGDTDDFEWSMQNFLREAETLATMDHSGIVRVLRKFEANGTAYFVMPFVQGIAFDQLISHRKEKNQPFTEEELRGLLERMLDALAYLHDRGIYHRDIKPANILITMDGIPTLIDFGSARQRLSERSMTVIESAGYTPFEQLQSRGNVGPWSDLYAMGATLAKAITGESPPKAADRVMDDPWPGLLANSRIAGCYSSVFLRSIDRSLAPSPSHRWQVAGEWQHYLQSGEAVFEMQQVAHPSAMNDWERGMDGDYALESDTGVVSSSSVPELWNPNAAVNLSLFLTPAFGAYLHARNSKFISSPNEQKKANYWFYAMSASVLIGALISPSFGRFGFIQLFFLILWYFAAAKKQIQTVKERFGQSYSRKSLIKPILVASGCWVVSVVFMEGLNSLVSEEHDVAAVGEVAPVESEPVDTKEDEAISYFNRGVKFANGEGVTQNYEEAVKWYRKAAEMGNLNAMNNLGACYEDGQGVPKDLEESVKWYRKAAEQGSAIAQRNVGLAYIRGEGVVQNNESALGWIKKSATQGDAHAQYLLGVGYSGIDGIPVNHSEMFNWFRKAAEQGHAAAQKYLGDCYVNGEGITANSTEAVKWYLKAAAQKDADAQNALGLCHENGTGVARDLFEARRQYQSAADQGNVNAQYNLGRCYRAGIGVVKDVAKAAEWYQKSAEQGHSSAQYALANCYANGDGKSQNSSTAVEWYQKSADQGNMDAEYSLAYCYDSGFGIIKDLAEAAKWYRKAADKGHSSAQIKLGVYFSRGDGVPKDLVSAYMWTYLATSSGEEQAKKNLEIFASSMSDDRVTEAVRMAAEWTVKHKK